MPRKTYTVGEVFRMLKAHDEAFEFYSNRGKGSHRMIYHPDVLGHPRSYPVPCHKKSDEVRLCYLKGIQRRFNLSADFF